MKLRNITASWLPVLALGLLPLLSSCSSNSKTDAIALIKNSSPKKIHAEASILKQELPDNAYIIQNHKWPDSFRLLDPLQVRNEPKGFKLLLVKFIGREEGVFVVTARDYEPHNQGSVTFESIIDGIYWYQEKE